MRGIVHKDNRIRMLFSKMNKTIKRTSSLCWEKGYQEAGPQPGSKDPVQRALGATDHVEELGL